MIYFHASLENREETGREAERYGAHEARTEKEHGKEICARERKKAKGMKERVRCRGDRDREINMRQTQRSVYVWHMTAFRAGADVQNP